ncbi:flagellar basal body-associated FliL family protein [Endozoicomonadaceae bacterium StTr2]
MKQIHTIQGKIQGKARSAVMAVMLTLSVPLLGGCDWLGMGADDTADAVMEPMYYEMAPIVVNLGASGSTRYLKVTPVLVTGDPNLYEQFEKKTPLIRNAVISMLRNETAETLLADGGFEMIRRKTVEELREVLLRDTGLQALGDVLFTEFVVQ